MINVVDVFYPGKKAPIQTPHSPTKKNLKMRENEATCKFERLT